MTRSAAGVPLREYLRAHRGAFLLLVVLPLVGPLAIAAYIQVLVSSRFEGRRWSLPSRLYSDALPLAPALRYPLPTLDAKLRRLGYRPVETDPKAPGEYQPLPAEGRLVVYLRDFDYALRPFTGFPVEIRWSGDTITALRRPDGPALARIAIEPEVIGTIYDQQMEDRTVVPLSAISPRLVEAVIAVEDREFFRHGGINPRGVLRAFFQNLRGRHQGDRP